MTDKGLTGHNTDHTSHIMITCTSRTGRYQDIDPLEENEKEQVPLGQQIHAVGMCFYKRGDLKKLKGITTSCVGIATIPKTC